MNQPPINMTDEYQTRDGRKVRIVDCNSPIKGSPVVGYVQTNGEWLIASWRRGGNADRWHNDDLDLQPVPKKHTLTYWLAHYRRGPVGLYLDKKELEILAGEGHNFIAITGPHEIEFTEGEGLAGAEGGA
jgi:hypothetical protein